MADAGTVEKGLDRGYEHRIVGPHDLFHSGVPFGNRWQIDTMNHIMSSDNLVLRSALLRASRGTATGEIVPTSILRDAVLRTAPQDGARGFNSIWSDPIGFMESVV
jgi:hypothetical protein